MRFAVFVSSIIIALYPSLVFANLPAPTGVVLDTYQKKDGTWHARLPSSYKGTLGKAGGLIKGVPRVAGHPVVVGGYLVVGGLAAWCKANKRKCTEKVGEDVVCVIVGNCEDDKDDICRFAWSITHYDPSRSDRDTTYNKHLDIYPKIINPNYLIKPHDDADDFMKDYENNSQKSYDGEWHTISNISIPIFIKFNDLSIEYYQSYGIFDMHYKCDGEYDEDDKQKDLLDALKKLHDSLEDDEIKNIVNNYYGDDIDIEKQCNGAYSCTTINEGDDNDTTNNNTKNDNDTTNNKTKKEDEDTTNNTTKGKGDEDELECNDTDLSKAVCKIIDWLDDEAEDPDDQKAKIKDEDYDDDLDDDTIDVSKGCPSNQTISYSMMGFGASIELPYHSICKFAQMVNPYVTASGAIVSFYIITGNRQS